MSTAGQMEPHEEMAHVVREEENETPPLHELKEGTRSFENFRPAMVKFDEFQRLTEEKSDLTIQLDNALDKLEELQFVEEENVELKISVKHLEADMDALCRQIETLENANAQPSPPKKKFIAKKQSVPIFVNVVDEDSDDDEGEQMIIESILPGGDDGEDLIETTGDSSLKDDLKNSRELVAMLQDRLREMEERHEAEVDETTERAKKTIDGLHKLVQELSNTNRELTTAAFLHEQERELMEEQIATLEERLAASPQPTLPQQEPKSSPPKSSTSKRLKKQASTSSSNPPSPKKLGSFTLDENDLADNEKLREVLERLRDENTWLTQCLTMVRIHHRDDQLLLPKRKGNEPALLTMQRANEKDILRNMDVVLEYLQSQGVPPESPISRQFAVMYQKCKEAENESSETKDHLIESLGELDTIRNLLGKDRGTALSAIKDTLTRMDTLQSNYDATVGELNSTKENFKLLDDQLNQLDVQLEQQGKEYQNTIADIQSKAAASIQRLEHELNQSSDVNEDLTNEIRKIISNLEKAASTTEDTQLRSRLKGTISQMRTTTSVGAGVSVGSSHIYSPHSPSKAPEIINFDNSLRRQGSNASQMGEQAHSAIYDLRKHMIAQEQRHQQEMQEVVSHSEALQRKQLARLKQLEQLASLSEEDLQNHVLSLEVQTEELAQERNSLQANLHLSEENVKRLQGSAEHHHENALQVEASFEVEMAALQEAMRRKALDHQKEVDHLRSLIVQSDEDKEKKLESVAVQLRREEFTGRNKDAEISKLLTEMKIQRENQTRQFHEIERHHEEEVTGMLQRHEAQVTKMDHTIKDLQDDLRITTAHLSASQQKVTVLSTELEKVQAENEELTQQHDREMHQISSSHSLALQDSTEMMQDLKLRNKDNIAQLEQQISQLQAEVQHGQDQLQSIASALVMKEAELESTREGFAEERATFDANASQLYAHVRDLEEEMATTKRARADQMAEMNAIVLEKEMQINALEQEIESLSAQVEGLNRDLQTSTAHFEGELSKMNQVADADKQRDRQHTQNMTANYKQRIEQLAGERDMLRAEMERLNAQFKQERSALIKSTDGLTTDLAASKVKYDREVRKLQANFDNNEEQNRQLLQELRTLKNAVAQHCREIQRTASTSPQTSEESLDAGNPHDLLKSALNSFLNTDQECVKFRDLADSLSTELDATKRTASDLKAELNSRTLELKQREGEARTNSNSLSTLEMRLSTATDRCGDLERENADLKSRLTSLQEELRDQAASSATSQAQLSSILDSVNAGFKNEKASFHQQVEGLRSDLLSAQERIGEMRVQIREQEEETQLLNSQVQALEAERDGLQQSLAIQKQKYASSEGEVHRMGEELAKLSGDISEGTAVNKRMQSELENANAFATALQDDLEKVQQEREKLSQDSFKLKQDRENLHLQLSDFEVVKQQHQNYAYEIESLKRTLNDQRQELDKTHLDFLSTKSQASREKRNQGAIIADLERQLQVAKTRQAKEKTALLKLEAQGKELIEDKARLERETGRQRGMLKKLQGQVQDLTTTIKEKERQHATLKKKSASLEDDVSTLQTQKRTMESKLRRDQSRRVANLSHTMDRSTLHRSVADSFILGNNSTVDTSERKMATGSRPYRSRNDVLNSTMSNDE
eukprot:m.95207 g.95207  ORF g.95207 m.95207 type:complete len:1639 (+) comp8941_c2_seq1:58-4974(+)